MACHLFNAMPLPELKCQLFPIIPRPRRTHFHWYLSKIQKFSLQKMHLKLSSARWCPFCVVLNIWTHKQLEKHGCIINTAATDVLVLKHQAISTHSDVQISIALYQLEKKYITLIVNNIRRWIKFWKKEKPPSCLRVVQTPHQQSKQWLETWLLWLF